MKVTLAQLRTEASRALGTDNVVEVAHGGSYRCLVHLAGGYEMVSVASARSRMAARRLLLRVLLAMRTKEEP